MIHIYFTTDAKLFKPLLPSEASCQIDGNTVTYLFPELSNHRIPNPLGQLQFCQKLLKIFNSTNKKPGQRFNLFTMNPLVFAFLKTVIQAKVVPSDFVVVHTVYLGRINTHKLDIHGDFVTYDGTLDDAQSFDFHCRFNPSDMMRDFQS